MNKKRAIYMGAFLVILAVLIVPALLQHSPSSQSLSGSAVSDSRTGNEKPAALDKEAATPSPNSSSVKSGAGETKGNLPAAPQQADEPAAKSGTDSKAAQGCQAGIAVVGIDGELLYAPAQVNVVANNKWGMTAMGALDATGLAYEMKPAWPDFVDAIGGQACQGVAGWMYMVNGEVSMHLASKHPIKEGDQVIWWYSESMDQELPAWDKLVKAQH